MQLDQRLGDGQAQAGTLVALGELAFDLFEGAAQFGQSFLGNANAAVGNAQHHVVVRHPSAHRDLAAGRGELDGVGQKIERDLLERAAVGAQVQLGRYPGAELELLVAGAGGDDTH